MTLKGARLASMPKNTLFVWEMNEKSILLASTQLEQEFPNEVKLNEKEQENIFRIPWKWCIFPLVESSRNRIREKHLTNAQNTILEQFAKMQIFFRALPTTTTARNRLCEMSNSILHGNLRRQQKPIQFLLFHFENTVDRMHVNRY